MPFDVRPRNVKLNLSNSLKCLKDACATKGVDLNKKIYISESLTPKKKKLFGSVNKLKKELKWKFIWTNHGRIYLKKGEDTQTHKIDSPLAMIINSQFFPRHCL